MRCDRYRKMLYLHRASELTERERAELQAHLRTCRRCATEQEKILRAGLHIEEIRRISPTLERPGELADRVMARIRKTGQPPAIRSEAGFFERFLDYFFLPSIRYASAAFVVLTVGSFFLQYFSILTSIDRLEQTMAIQAQGRTTLEIAYAVRTEEVRQLSDPKLLETLSPFRDQAREDDTIIVSGRALDWLLSLIDGGTPNLLARQYRVDRERQHIDLLIHNLQKVARPLLKVIIKGA